MTVFSMLETSVLRNPSVFGPGSPPAQKRYPDRAGDRLQSRDTSPLDELDDDDIARCVHR